VAVRDPYPSQFVPPSLRPPKRSPNEWHRVIPVIQDATNYHRSDVISVLLIKKQYRCLYVQMFEAYSSRGQCVVVVVVGSLCAQRKPGRQRWLSTINFHSGSLINLFVSHVSGYARYVWHARDMRDLRDIMICFWFETTARSLTVRSSLWSNKVWIRTWLTIMTNVWGTIFYTFWYARKQVITDRCVAMTTEN